ncbi:MAG: FHA domain-containing protein [Pseudomonadota bacterium]|nr:FHA domain-containing protein [Pseudomonadota bacterium]
MSRLCRDPDFDRGLVLAREGSRSLIDFCLDARGLWLHVAEGVGGVHVNGRPVRNLALLRAGDTIHCEGVEMCVGEEAGRAARALPEFSASDAQTKLPVPVLRGLCGSDHGRALPVERMLKIGGKGADIVLEGQQGVLAHLHYQQGQVWLQVLKAEQAVQLNGERLVLAQLQHGDQLSFAPGSRYLLEVPGQAALAAVQKPPLAAIPQEEAGQSRLPHRWQLPWLLLAAILSAAVLAALLWFGVK